MRRRLIPAVLGLALFGSCAPQRTSDLAPAGTSAAEMALGPGRGTAPDDPLLPVAVLQGVWERRVDGGGARCSFDGDKIHLAAVVDRSGKEAFFVQGRWKLAGRNVLVCEETDTSPSVDSRSIPGLSGAEVIQCSTWLESSPFWGSVFSEPKQVPTFSFHLRQVGDGVVIDRFESENFTDRAKRFLEGSYQR